MFDFDDIPALGDNALEASVSEPEEEVCPGKYRFNGRYAYVAWSSCVLKRRRNSRTSFSHYSYREYDTLVGASYTRMERLTIMLSFSSKARSIGAMSCKSFRSKATLMQFGLKSPVLGSRPEALLRTRWRTARRMATLLAKDCVLREPQANKRSPCGRM